MKITKEPINLTLSNHTATLFRDPNGVIQIDTDDPMTLAKFTGFVHAHDRQLQMMLVRLISKGQLCEFLKDDEESLGIDIFMRELALSHEAEQEVSQIKGDTYSFAQAYCDGVNDYLLNNPRPFEFKLTGYKPTPWKISDTLSTLKIMSYIGLAQTQNDIEKFIALSLKEGVPLQNLKSLFFPHLEKMTEGSLELLKKTSIYRKTVPEEVKFLSSIPKILASNNWVISSKKSKSGGPIHCADPHLEVNRLPGIWYEMVGKTVNNYYMGITMPGVPGLIMGRNKNVAFSFSYGFMDMIDFFIEEIKDEKYRDGEQFFPLEQRTEVIKRKKNPDYRFKFYETPRGPVEKIPSDIAIENGHYLSRSWSGHKNGSIGSIKSLFDLHRATNVEEASETLSKVTISCNWLISDTDDNIGYQQSGLLPNRKHSGLYPVAGYKKENQWDGICHPGQLGNLKNPTEGYLLTANNDLNQDGKPLSINMPLGSYRAERIDMLLKDADLLDVDDMMEIQKDLYSLQAREIIQLISPFIQNSGKAEILNKWDKRYDKNSIGATVFEMLYRQILIEVFGPKCFGKEAMKYLIDNTRVTVDYYQNFDKILLGKNYQHSDMWFEGNRSDFLEKIVSKFIEKLDTSSLKSWGEMNQVTMKNLFFGGKLPHFLGFDYGPISIQGGRATIVQGVIYKAEGRVSASCPSWRFITKMNEHSAYTNLAGGVSDRRFSKLYLSGIKEWLSFKYKKMSLDYFNSSKNL